MEADGVECPLGSECGCGGADNKKQKVEKLLYIHIYLQR